MTFEPSEVERLPIPFKGSERVDLAMVEANLRIKDVDSILTANDELLLDRELNLSGKDIRMLNGIWKKLRDSRINRK